MFLATCKNTADVCVLIMHSASLLYMFTSPRIWGSLSIFQYITLCHSDSLTFTNFWMSLISLSCFTLWLRRPILCYLLAVTMDMWHHSTCCFLEPFDLCINVRPTSILLTLHIFMKVRKLCHLSNHRDQSQG